MIICILTAGALARPGNIHNAFVKASPLGDPLWPDIQLLFVGTTLASDIVLASSFYNFDANVSDHFNNNLKDCTF